MISFKIEIGMLSIFIGGSFLTGFTVSINKQTIFRYFNHSEEIKNKISFLDNSVCNILELSKVLLQTWFAEDDTKLSIYNPRQNIWLKVKKSRKIGQK